MFFNNLFNLDGIEFVHPNIAYFSALVFLLLVFFYFWKRKTEKRLAINSPFFAELKEVEKEISFWKRPKILIFLKWFSFLLALSLLTVALMRPQKISVDSEVSKKGVDILIALDVSESMLAEDLKPNRIEAAKEYISKFVSKLKTDRVGLEVFAGKTFTQSPMSFDYNVVRYYLSEISTDSINQQIYGLNGTAIGDAILSAVNRFKNSPDRTKVLILLTDGEANVGNDPLFTAEHARSNGIKIYTIGLGKKEGALMPIGLRNGHKIYARNPDGSLYRTKFDEETLKNIAKISGGEYFWAGDNKSLDRALETIGKLEKKEYKAETITKKEDLFYPWLFWGFVMTLISVLILLFNNNILDIKKYAFWYKHN